MQGKEAEQVSNMNLQDVKFLKCIDHWLADLYTFTNASMVPSFRNRPIRVFHTFFILDSVFGRTPDMTSALKVFCARVSCYAK